MLHRRWGGAWLDCVRTVSGTPIAVRQDGVWVACDDGGNETDPAIMAVLDDGWRVTYNSPPPEFDYEGDPRRLIVDSPGFDAQGSPTTVRREVLLTKRVRLPYPDQHTLTEDHVALSDYVFVSDTVVGGAAANESEADYPLPIPLWLHEDRRIIDDDTVTLRLTVAHAYARRGRPVAAVKLIVTDGVTSREVTVSELTPVYYSATGITVPAFEADLDLTGLELGEVTCDAIIYPWVGEPYQASVDGTPAPTSNFGTQVVINNSGLSRPRVYAYVDGIGASPAVSTDRATALASGFESIGAARDAILAFNDANHGSAEADFGVIVLAEGTWQAPGMGSTPTNVAPLTFEAETAGTPETHVLRAAENSNNGLPNHLVIRGIRCETVTDARQYTWSNGGALANTIVLHNCDWYQSNGTGQDTMLGRSGRVWAVNCTGISAPNAGSYFSGDRKQIVLLGSATLLGNAVYHAAGSRKTPSSSTNANMESKVGTFAGWSTTSIGSGSSPAFNLSQEVGPRGAAFVGCVAEVHGTQTGAAAFFNADNSRHDTQNVVVQGNTVVGDRVNYNYNDVDFSDKRLCFYQANVSVDFNVKTDVFGKNGTFVGNWPIAYQVGSHSILAAGGSSAGDRTAGVGSWLGEVQPPNTVFGGGPTIPIDFVDNRSRSGSGEGGGDYRLTAAGSVPRIPAGRLPYSIDRYGNAVPDDGTALAGAFPIIAD